MVINILVTERNSMLWKRALAFLVDFILVWGLVILIHLISPMQAVFANWLFMLLFLGFNMMFDYYSHGTPGKQLMKIRIEYSYDKRSYLLTIFYRDCLKVFLVATVVGMLLAPYRQGLHNRIAKCSIVDAK